MSLRFLFTMKSIRSRELSGATGLAGAGSGSVSCRSLIRRTSIYCDQRGTFSNIHGRGYDLTLIEAEALDSLDLPARHLTREEARRNIVTRGIDLNALVGDHFRVGDVECFGQRLCEPARTWSA